MSPGAAVASHVDVRGVRVPTLLYGTAWKEERTQGLVSSALRAGFRGLDTANQRRHYHEAAVGEALRAAFADGTVAREDVFVQTKFTYVRSQDHRLPYDPRAPFAEQVARSFGSSLEHLGVDHVDAYLLHGPWTYPGLAEADREAWRAMEALHREGRVRLLGVSNVTAGQLRELHETADVRPALVQNRTFTRPGADGEVRAFCKTHGLGYEGFSLLTAAPGLLDHPTVRAVALRTGGTPAEVALRACLARGMIVLTGTTSAERMRGDLAIRDVALTADEEAAFAALLG